MEEREREREKARKKERMDLHHSHSLTSWEGYIHYIETCSK